LPVPPPPPSSPPLFQAVYDKYSHKPYMAVSGIPALPKGFSFLEWDPETEEKPVKLTPVD